MLNIKNRFEQVTLVAGFNDRNFVQLVVEFVRRIDEIEKALSRRR